MVVCESKKGRPPIVVMKRLMFEEEFRDQPASKLNSTRVEEQSRCKRETKDRRGTTF